jgi:hypothetical protein
MSARPSLSAAAGFTVVELMASMATALVVCGALFTLMDAARRTAATNAEVDDLQQRLRAALQTVAGELVNAGAGPDRTPLAGPLGLVFPPVVPYRRGQVGDDAQAGVTFRPDVLSVAYVAGSPAQAEVARTADLGGRLRLELRPNCGPRAPVSVCGFAEGMRVVLLEASGAHDFLTVEAVDGGEVEVSYRGRLSSTYAAGTAVLAHVSVQTFARRPDPATGIPQLTQYDGFLTERPAVDHVVGLSFEYFGEAAPPRLRPGAEPGVAPGPWTTYGPSPPPVDVDDASTAWAEGENCVFTVADGRHEPRLAALGALGDLVPLPAGLFGDGPWCPDSNAARRFDADLLRVRQVRVRVRAEVAPRTMRGAAGAFFSRRGVASAAVTLAPDQEAVLDIVPRNLATRR